MRFLFDTSALSIAMSRQRVMQYPGFGDWLRTVPRRDQFTCATVVGELFFGMQRLPRSQRRIELHERIREILAHLTVVPYDIRAAERYGEVHAALEGGGRTIGEADMQIAACALVHDCAVVTHNRAHFSWVDGLLVHPV